MCTKTGTKTLCICPKFPKTTFFFIKSEKKTTFLDRLTENVVPLRRF